MLTILCSIIVGSVAALLWGYAFSLAIKIAVVVGGVVGLVLGLLLLIFGKFASCGGNIKSGEAMFVNGAILGLIALLAIGSGLLALIIRLIFF